MNVIICRPEFKKKTADETENSSYDISKRA